MLCAPTGPGAIGCGAAGATLGAAEGAAAGGLIGGGVAAAAGNAIDRGIALFSKAAGGGGGGDGFKSPTSGSGKEKASDAPSWVRQNSANRPLRGEAPNQTAARVMNGKYGEGGWSRASGEYSKIQKWAARSFK